ncbi:MAG: response regulator [Nitrospirota bacterium]
MAAKHTILLVDDEASARTLVSAMLERSGYDVLAVADGSAAITALQERGDIDLVIADYRMPGMDGLGLIRRIKERTPDLPVVMMTGYGDLESYLCAAGLGVVRYVGKPIGMRQLQQTVRDAMAEGVRPRPLKQVQAGSS